MSGIMDRLNNELETIGKQARRALDDGRLQIEKFRLQRERDEAARKLGYLFHQRERGRTIDQLEMDAWLVRIDVLEESIQKVEREMAAEKVEAVTVQTKPAPASATTGESEIT